MGDRVLMQVYNSQRPDEFGPVVYCHWSGYRTPAIVAALQERMKGRPGDIEYTSARLAQECIGDETGNTGFGIWNVERLLTAEDSHGDAGVVLLDVSNGLKPTYLGGYLK